MVCSESDLQELMRLISNLVDSQFAGSAKAAFDFYDKNATRGLDVIELTAMLKDARVSCFGGMQSRIAEAIINRVDGNADREVSFEEFVTVSKR